MRDFHPVSYTAAGLSLATAFGAEYDNLTADHRKLIQQDFLEACCSSTEYRRRIGNGNLQAYADVMVVRERKGWDHG